jgi:hypothetical protein
MVRVKAPLFSLDASGTIGKSIVFANWKGRNYVRRHAIPANPNSGLQVGIRSVFRFISQDYKNLTAGQQNDWVVLAAADNITPLDAQIRDAITRARRNLGWRMDNTAVDPGAIDAPTGGTATVQPKTLVVGWTEPAANKPDYCYALYASTTTGFTPDVANLIAAVKFPTVSFTHTHLITGTPYYYRVRGLSKSGKLGTLLAQWTGTPS